MALVARLAMDLCDRFQTLGLPPSVLDQFPGRFDRLVSQITTTGIEHYGPGDDLFLKDVRFAASLSVPCGAEDLDLYGTVSRAAGLKSAVVWKDPAAAWPAVRFGGPLLGSDPTPTPAT